MMSKGVRKLCVVTSCQINGIFIISTLWKASLIQHTCSIEKMLAILTQRPSNFKQTVIIRLKMSAFLKQEMCNVALSVILQFCCHSVCTELFRTLNSVFVVQHAQLNHNVVNAFRGLHVMAVYWQYSCRKTKQITKNIVLMCVQFSQCCFFKW